MSMQENQTDALFDVVVNQEQQYSIWACGKAMPLGWVKAGKQGQKQECLDFIKEVWTDMRPLSLRNQMQSAS